MKQLSHTQSYCFRLSDAWEHIPIEVMIAVQLFQKQQVMPMKDFFRELDERTGKKHTTKDFVSAEPGELHKTQKRYLIRSGVQEEPTWASLRSYLPTDIWDMLFRTEEGDQGLALLRYNQKRLGI